jgi:carboxypeptidase Taq
VAAALGYDFSAGRLDLAAHPFMSGGAPGDVRITTRVNPGTFTDCLYSVIHEAGHALYQHGIAPLLTLTPAGAAVSMALHESQSRLWENQVGRGRAFVGWLTPKLVARFPDLEPKSPDELYAAINTVSPTLIRTESDEITYNLHIILRFELELELLSGNLAVADLEEAWNERMGSDLGLEVSHPGEGVLQDIHWSGGAFGYFPTYTVGNLYAAELFAAAGAVLGDVEAMVGRGELGPLRAWLLQNVHAHGSTSSVSSARSTSLLDHEGGLGDRLVVGLVLDPHGERVRAGGQLAQA